jgi:hypothetical protein
VGKPRAMIACGSALAAGDQQEKLGILGPHFMANHLYFHLL